MVQMDTKYIIGLKKSERVKKDDPLVFNFSKSFGVPIDLSYKVITKGGVIKRNASKSTAKKIKIKLVEIGLTPIIKKEDIKGCMDRNFDSLKSQFVCFLEKYRGKCLYFDSELSLGKASNVDKFCALPDNKHFVAFIEDDPFGKGRSGIAICLDGIYWFLGGKTVSGDRFLGWDEISKLILGAKVNFTGIKLSSKVKIPYVGSDISGKELVFILKGLSSIVDDAGWCPDQDKEKYDLVKKKQKNLFNKYRLILITILLPVWVAFVASLASPKGSEVTPTSREGTKFYVVPQSVFCLSESSFDYQFELISEGIMRYADGCYSTTQLVDVVGVDCGFSYCKVRDASQGRYMWIARESLHSR